jgi:hypothetical protein
MVCIRGFAKLGDLAQVSEADENYQRELIEEHSRIWLMCLAIWFCFSRGGSGIFSFSKSLG